MNQASDGLPVVLVMTVGRLWLVCMRSAVRVGVRQRPVAADSSVCLVTFRSPVSGSCLANLEKAWGGPPRPRSVCGSMRMYAPI